MTLTNTIRTYANKTVDALKNYHEGTVSNVAVLTPIVLTAGLSIYMALRPVDIMSSELAEYASLKDSLETKTISLQDLNNNKKELEAIAEELTARVAQIDTNKMDAELKAYTSKKKLDSLIITGEALALIGLLGYTGSRLKRKIYTGYQIKRKQV